MRDFVLVVVVAVASTISCWWAAEALGAEVPKAAKAHRSVLTRAARAEWGLDAPVATFAAQVHQESYWRADARSHVGAQGLAQFMPSTAKWWAELTRSGPARPWNPGWALRGLTGYDKWLWNRVKGTTPCDRMAMTLAAYNGGLGWVQRDTRLALQKGLDPLAWWGAVEAVNAGRCASAFKENRGYPARILLKLEQIYEAAGWGPGMCP